MTTAQANHRLRTDLKLVMRDAEDLLKATVGSTNDRLGDLRARLASAMESAKDTCGQLQEKTVLAAQATDKAIRTHPYQSLGIALATGLVIGALAARR